MDSIINHNQIGWYTQVDETEVRETTENSALTDAKETNLRWVGKKFTKFASHVYKDLIEMIVVAVILGVIFYFQYPQKIENIETKFDTTTVKLETDLTSKISENYVLLSKAISDLHNTLDESIDDNYKDIEELIGGLVTTIDNNENRIIVNETKITNILEDIKEIKYGLDPYKSSPVIYKGDISLIHSDLQNNIEDPLITTMSSPAVLKTQVIAKDKTGKEFTVAEMENTPMLFSYTDGDKTVIFIGQLNENNHWDGNCLTNVYEDGELTYIMDATYEDGVVTNYNQVLKGENSSGTDSWYVISRINHGDYNSGETWQYGYEDHDFNLTESSDNLSSNSIRTFESFKYLLTTPLEGYYNGNTSNGLYNDTTEQAYLVKYFADGKVKTLYQGNFKNGLFDDDTGNAWDISKENDTPYMYYKGYYKDGDKINNEGSTFEHDLTLERIQEILGNKTYNVDLEWDYQIY
jgi:hypothetical protein